MRGLTSLSNCVYVEEMSEALFIYFFERITSKLVTQFDKLAQKSSIFFLNTLFVVPTWCFFPSPFSLAMLVCGCAWHMRSRMRGLAFSLVRKTGVRNGCQKVSQPLWKKRFNRERKRLACFHILVQSLTYISYIS